MPRGKLARGDELWVHSVGSDHPGRSRHDPLFPHNIQLRQFPAAKQADRVARMGFILNDDIRSQHDQPGDTAKAVPKDQPNCISGRSFTMAGLISDQVSTPTCMKEEIVLLSWLIVLLRTREDGRASYEWTYQPQGDVSKREVAFKLSTDEVLPRLQNNVEDTLALISRHIENVKGNLGPAESSPTSLLLSTGFLSESADSAKDDVGE